MEKEDLVTKHHSNLKFLDLGGNSIGGFAINYKEIQKQAKPEWPKILEFFA